MTTDKWHNLFPGEPAFILGTGPSIKDCDLSLIEDALTIGVNHAFRNSTLGSIPLDPTILLWQDLRFYRTERDRLKDCESILVGAHHSVRRFSQDDLHERVVTYELTTFCEWGKQTGKLKGLVNSGALAFQLAQAMGCYPIVLIGCDGARHESYHGHNPAWSGHTRKLLTKSLQVMKQHSDDDEIVNCSYSNIARPYSLQDAIQGMAFKGRKHYQDKLMGGIR